MKSFLNNLIMLLIFWEAAAAQQPNLSFEHISIEDGLSEVTINCILQDSKGFMWFGTDDGLNKYDGYNITIFRNDPDYPNSLSRSGILSIHEDRTGTIWIGTESGGLNKFDREKQQFTHYKHDPDKPNSLSSNRVMSIHEDRSGRLWIGTQGGGLNKFDRENEQFTHYKHDPDNPKSLSNNTVRSIYEDRSGRLWIGTQGGGLNRFDRENEQFTHFKHDPDNSNSLSNDIVMSIFEDRSGTLWIGTKGGGLNKFDREKEQFTHYRHDPDNPNSLSSDIVRSIHEDGSGWLWIGTKTGGLNKFDREKEQFTNYKHYPNRPNSLSNNYVLSIYEDRSGTLWIGTDGGISKFNRNKEKFGHYKHDPNNPNSLNNDLVWSIYEDRSGIIWIGTEGGGLNKFDRQKEQFSYYKHDSNNLNSLSNNLVWSIYEDRSGTLWIGTDGGGVDKFDPEKEQFTHYKHDPDNPKSLSNDIVWSIYEDRSGIMWIGTSDGGLNKFDREKEQFTHYKHDPDNPKSLSFDNVYTIYEDRSGTLWIGTYGGGLNKFDREKEQFTHYKHDPDNPNSLSNNIVFSIYEDRSGRLWIGTAGGGLNKFDREKEQFSHYREKDGLPNDVIYGILEDNNNYIWLSTNKGLSKFNPKTEEFRNYDVKDGLQSNEFNGGAYFQSEDGRLFFGGVNGINIFHPDSLRDNEYIPPVVVTDFKIFNKSVTIQSGGSVGEIPSLPVHISETDEIILSYKESVFSFEFSALDYSIPEKNQYAYMMEGFDENWVYTDAKTRFATYTNLDAGEYVFKVKASNSDGIWNEEGHSIKIIITPPYWQTLWFRMLSIITIVALVITVHRLRTKDIETRNKTLQEEINERKYTEEALRNEKIFHETLFQSAPEAIVALDNYDLITNLNNEFELLFGYTNEDSIGKSINDLLVSEEYREEADQMSAKCISGQRVLVETKRKNKDGTLIDVSVLGAPILNAESRQIGTYAIYRDLTETHKFQNQLSDKEKRLESTLYLSVNAMITIDEKGFIESFNKAAVTIFGYTEDEMIGENINTLMPDPDKINHDGYLDNYHLTGLTKMIGTGREVEGKRKNGETFPLKLSVSRIDLDNRTIYTEHIEDLTEQKKADKEKLELQEKLIQSERLESLGLLAGGVAHDLNNIIGPIMAYPALIRMDLAEGKPIDQDLEAISASAQRAADVISDLLALTRRGKYEMASIDLNDLVNDYLFSAECKSAKIIFPEVKADINLSKEQLLFNGSNAHLPKVIMNLINNAFESMQDGGVLSISSSSIDIEDGELSEKNIPKGRYNLLTIEDQGEGISEENLSRIFDPFFTTKKKSGKSGTGLGLSVVYNVIKDHGAYIDVESKLGIGTKFSIYFPETTERKERTEKDKQMHTGSGSILVVDDRGEQRDIATRLLTMLGYDVESVGRGRDAVEYLKKEHVDLLLLDMILEDDMDGLDTYKEIIKIKPDQKTIIVSGYSESDRVKEAEELGVEGFIQKPYKMDEIGKTIQAVLNGGNNN